MRTKSKNPLLVCINNIYEHSAKSKLSNDLFKKIDKDLKAVATYLQVNKSQAFFTSLIFSLNYKGDTVDIKDLVEYLECSPVKILEHSEDFESLCSRGIIIKKNSKHLPNVFLLNNQFSIESKITEAIIKDLPLPELSERMLESDIEFLEKVNELIEKRDNKEISTNLVFREFLSIFSIYRNLPVIGRTYNLNIGIEDSFVYLYLVWKTINGDENVELSTIAELLYDSASLRLIFMQSIIAGNSRLVELELIDFSETTFSSSISVSLSAKALRMINEDGINIITKKLKNAELIDPINIKAKDLFFNDRETKELKMLYDIMKDDNFKSLQERMVDRKLPVGITVLLHGQPGTGKTETVYQVAKATNREIYQVDISKTKSCWFGESEKIIKRVFTDYNEYIKQCSYTPILLLNEADAVISKRKSVSSSNVAQTENAIQNIILEELEKFKGILIATTNLVDNIDPAFDRRFLFKVEFSKPSISVKSKIWKSKLPDLSVDECNRLSEMFDLSGGQIDNIVRKCEMHELLNSEKTPFNKLVEFCKSEQLITVERSKVGFTRKSA